jgi:hypothetical protein
MEDRFLAQITRILRDQYRCHTVILYGSRARDDSSPGSDYDLLGFRKTGPVVHDARKIRGRYLDAFVYPEKRARPKELLRARGGRVIFQKGTFGEDFLARLTRLYARGPKPLPTTEIEVRKLWAQKMLDRAKRRDSEGNYRRIWLMYTLLEDYFALRGLWYEGSKAALQWLKQNDPAAHALFDAGLKPGARLSIIEKLAALVTDVAG